MTTSLFDEDASTNVKFSTVWKFGAVLAMAMLTSTTGLLFTWGVWVTWSINRHSEQLAVVNSKAGITNSLTVGAVDGADKAADAGSARTWLTTQDVAKREGVTDRTVINYIKDDQIFPPPRQEGKAWMIAHNYVILPKTSEPCGTEPND